MSVQIVHKRNETPGAVPDKTALQFGEFAINGADGELFLKTLNNPTAGTSAENQTILAIRRPRVADGGEIVAQQ